MSGNNGLFYYLTDHLGSTSVLLTSSNGIKGGSTTRYHPFGSYRGTAPSQTITDRHYTGHAHNDDLGLVYMNARYYVGSIGRFASADSLVPDKENPQAFNRYSYVANNPLLFVDESGHCWGAFSFARDINVGGYGYGTTCANIDQALSIVQHPDATVGEKALAGGYIGTQVVAHGTAVVGTTAAAVGCLTGAGTAICAGTGSAVSAASADNNPTNEIKLGLDAFSKASEFGIKSFSELGKLTKGTGLQRHHIVEQRFADTLNITKPGNMPSIALTPKEHLVFTNAWRNAIAYNNSGKPITTANATKDQIWRAAQDIYAKYPILLDSAKGTILD